MLDELAKYDTWGLATKRQVPGGGVGHWLGGGIYLYEQCPKRQKLELWGKTQMMPEKAKTNQIMTPEKMEDHEVDTGV